MFHSQPTHAVIVIDPNKINELVDVGIGDTKEDAIRLIGKNNIDVPLFVQIDFHPSCDDWFIVDKWYVPPQACESILYV